MLIEDTTKQEAFPLVGEDKLRVVVFLSHRRNVSNWLFVQQPKATVTFFVCVGKTANSQNLSNALRGLISN